MLPGMVTGFVGVAGGWAMEGAANEFLRTLESCFADLWDPRVQASCDHLLIDILEILILTVT